MVLLIDALLMNKFFYCHSHGLVPALDKRGKNIAGEQWIDNVTDQMFDLNS